MYCLTATGKKNNMRLISVVMGEENTDKRSSDTLAMMDYGFSMYKINNLVNKDNNLGNIKVNLGKKEWVSIVSTKNVDILNNTQKNDRNVNYEIDVKTINAPIKIGDVVGKIYVYEDNKLLDTVDITVNENIDKANIFVVFMRNMKNIFSINI